MNLQYFKLSIHRLSQSSLVRNTLWMFFARGLQLVSQAFYFVIVVRALGVEQYGIFITATSFVSLVSPFATLGLGNLLVKNVSRDRSLFRSYWGNSLLMLFISASLLTLSLLIVAPIFLPESISLQLIFIVAITDLFLSRFIEVCGQAFQAFNWLHITAKLKIIPSIIRLLAAIILVYMFSNPDALDWTYFIFFSFLFVGIINFLLVNYNLGYPKLALSRIQPEIAEGFYFSIGLSAQTVYNNIDKAMLGSISSVAAAGIYATAYRLIDVAFVPISSLLAASYPKFFQHGKEGIHGSLKFAKQLLPISVIYSVVAVIALFLISPIIPSILGSEYVNATEALVWLSPLIVIKTIHYFAADTLTGAGFQGMRSAMQIIIALFNVLINLWLIPLYSWKGAALSSLASDGLLMFGLWLIVIYLKDIKNNNINQNSN
ncbi:MAG: oligosaccharide flippase family protein [Calothrix sp. MO_167.B42]|nr:oligosaccharide flippase family protein [Calothrix sp. MO_167.B42]